MFYRTELCFLSTLWLWLQWVEILIMIRLLSSCGTGLLQEIFVLLSERAVNLVYLSVSRLFAP